MYGVSSNLQTATGTAKLIEEKPREKNSFQKAEAERLSRARATSDVFTSKPQQLTRLGLRMRASEVVVEL